MTHTVTVYQSGNSNVITIPASLGVKKGDQFVLRKQKDDLVLSKVPETKEEQIKKLHELLGNGFLGLTKGVETPEKLEKFLEGIYD